jgi:adenine deaminase
MLTPAGFARFAVRHGTVAVVADPHEIANVAGINGIDYMIENGKTVPLKYFFGAPSCVPATEFESSGARLDPTDVRNLLKRDDIYFLSEMMNFPGVINGDDSVIRKIISARELNKPIDGHAPGLTGQNLIKYISTGITTDHECVTLEEAVEKIGAGMKIQIREGSAARGFDLFCGLIDRFPDSVMLCSDDMHPDDLIEGHMNKMLARGMKNGINIYNLVRAATVNPALHYNLPVGLLREGDYADLVKVKDLHNFEVLETFINGKTVYRNGNVLFEKKDKIFRKKFRKNKIDPQEIKIIARGRKIRIIDVRDGELYTGEKIDLATIRDGFAVADAKRDICKIVVINKYQDNKVSAGFISGFGLIKGAIAGSVAHDSHNIIAVGTDDNEIADAVNTVLDMGGGLTAVSSGRKLKLQLEIAGLMTNQEGELVAHKYKELDEYAKELGSRLTAPFMSLSFMSLLVIPELKIGDRGLFDVNKFSFTSLFAE